MELHVYFIILTYISGVCSETISGVYSETYQRFCLLDSSAASRPAEVRYTPLDYVTGHSLCTHLVYTYATVNDDVTGLATDQYMEDGNVCLDISVDSLW